jgi:hypothetical protein
VIVGAIDALRAGAVIGITRAEAEIELGVPPVMKLSPAPPSVLLLKEAQPLAEVARFFPSLGVAYEGAAWASAVAWHAIGGSFGVRTESLSLNLTALAHLPIVVDHPAVGLRVDGVSARVDGAWHVPLGPRLGAYVGVGVGLDRLRIEPRAAGASESQASPGGVRTAWVPTARSTVAIEGRASTNLRLRLGFFLERDLAPRNYVVQRSSGEFETVVEPLSVRPGVSLVIAADL